MEVEVLEGVSGSNEQSPPLEQKGLPFIKSLAGLKAITLILLFWWHAPFTYKPPVDLGARTCEILFVCSGFLVGYNYYNKNVAATWAESHKWVLRKLIVFWPLHAMCMILTLFFHTLPHISPDASAEAIFIAAVRNLALLHAWGNRGPFAYLDFNGASWFLSALLFCYFIAPQFLQILKKRTISFFLFIASFFFRYILEYISYAYPQQFWDFSLHSSPIPRSLEFLMGLFLSSVFLSLKESLTAYTSHTASPVYTVVFSTLEIIVVSGIIYLAIAKNGIWYRAMFVLLFALLTFVLAFDEGIVSRLLAFPPLQWFSMIQFEFFIIHQAMIYSFRDPMFATIRNWDIVSALLFFIVLGLSIIARFLTKRLRVVSKRI